MPNPSTNPAINKNELSRDLYRLNFFFDDESMWFAASAKKDHVDLFDVPIPIGATYYKRSIGLRTRPLMILSERSLARVYHCLSAANAKFDILADILAEEDQILIEELAGPQPKGDG